MSISVVGRGANYLIKRERFHVPKFLADKQRDVVPVPTSLLIKKMWAKEKLEGQVPSPRMNRRMLF